MVVSGYAAPASVTGVTITFTVFALTAVVLRLLTRLRIVKSPGLDDILITCGMIADIGLMIATCIEVHYGVGKHTKDLTISETVITSKALYTTIVLYNVAMCFTKFSILYQYLRVFATSKPFKQAAYATMAVVAVYELWAIMSAIFFCWPISKFWNITSSKGTCLSRKTVWFANAAVNIATDFTIAILPIPMINTLQLARRTKLTLMAVFGLAGFTCIVSCLRLQGLYAIAYDKDQSWNNGLAALWSVVEINTGIVCSCLPTLKGLIVLVMPTTFASRSSTHNSGDRLGVIPAAKVLIGAAKIEDVDHRDRLRKESDRSSYNGKSKTACEEMGLELGAPVHHTPATLAYAERGRARSQGEAIKSDLVGTSPHDIVVTTTVAHDFHGKNEHISTPSVTGSTSELVQHHERASPIERWFD